MAARSARPAQPRHSDPLTRKQIFHRIPHLTHDFVTENEGQLWLFEIAIADVQVGPADAALADPDQDLTRVRDGEVTGLEGFPDLPEAYGFHVVKPPTGED